VISFNKGVLKLSHELERQDRI